MLLTFLIQTIDNDNESTYKKTKTWLSHRGCLPQSLTHWLFMLMTSIKSFIHDSGQWFGDTPGNISNTHPGEDDAKNVMWCYKLNNYCPSIWWEILLMLSANILISIQGHAVKNSASSKDILCHLVGIFFLSWGWKSITVLLVCIYSLISCPSLRCAYINWKTPLFLFIGKLMTCKEDKLVSLKSIKPLIRQIKLRVIFQVILYHVLK